jgi:hypothetical protein
MHLERRNLQHGGDKRGAAQHGEQQERRRIGQQRNGRHQHEQRGWIKPRKKAVVHVTAEQRGLRLRKRRIVIDRGRRAVQHQPGRGPEDGVVDAGTRRVLLREAAADVRPYQKPDDGEREGCAPVQHHALAVQPPAPVVTASAVSRSPIRDVHDSPHSSFDGRLVTPAFRISRPRRRHSLRSVFAFRATCVSLLCCCVRCRT